METVRPAAVPTSSSSSSSARSGGLLRSVTTKLIRGRKAASTKVGSDANGNHNNSTKPLQQKQQEYLDDYAVTVFGRSSDVKDHNLKTTKQHLQVIQNPHRDGGHEGASKDLDALLASVFASISAIKAGYAQIQVAQQPYDPETIQAADVTVVHELRQISQLKQLFHQRKQQLLLAAADDGGHGSITRAEAEIREKKNLVAAYEINAKRLEAELQSKNQEVADLREMLLQIENKNHALEHRLRHPRSASRSPATTATMSTLDGLHLSGLDPTHFLVALRYAVRSVGDFAEVLVHEMEAAGWDVDAAAAAIAPCAAAKEAPPEARQLALESYVYMGMFSDLHLGPGFRVPPSPSSDKADSASSRRQCFDEFSAARSCDSAKDLARLRRPFAEFCRAKYAAIVRPQMESAFFAGMDRRAMADANLFVAFAEMARRVWLLHWLFCSFEPEAHAYMFRAAPGTRFSEVYMDSLGATSVSSPSDAAAEMVGFTVVPGFRLRGTVIQCKVYLATTSSSGQGRR